MTKLRPVPPPKFVKPPPVPPPVPLQCKGAEESGYCSLIPLPLPLQEQTSIATTLDV